MPPTLVVGRNIRAAMIKAGRTQDVLAQRLGLSQGSISARLNGRTPLDVNELVTIADLLRVPLAHLLDGVEQPATAPTAPAVPA